jgi:hypothetical protein
MERHHNVVPVRSIKDRVYIGNLDEILGRYSVQESIDIGKCSYRRTLLNFVSRRLGTAVQTSTSSVGSPSSAPNPELNTQEGFGRNETGSLLALLSPSQTESLFRTYFTCIHPVWPLLYKPIYDSIPLSELAGRLPKALVYAIFAISSCLQNYNPSKSPERIMSQLPSHTQSGAAGVAEQYVHAAVLELQRGENIEQGPSLVTALNPTISNCQVLTVLALQQHGVAEFARAGIFCTLAGSMAFELRLHRNTLSHSEVEKEVACRLWWNIFILDKMLATEMGRPTTLRAEDSDAPYPSISESDEYELFTLAQQRGLRENESVPVIKLRTISMFHTTINFSKIMEKVVRDIYGLTSRELLRKDRVLGDNTRMALSQELEELERNTETATLIFDMDKRPLAPPAAVTNYVVGYAFIIETFNFNADTIGNKIRCYTAAPAIHCTLGAV